MKKQATCVLLSMAINSGLASAQTPTGRSGVRRDPVQEVSAAAIKINMPYVDAKPIIESLRADLLPAALKGKTPGELESTWPSWVARHDAEIRARLERGDEDSIVNLLLFGVTFTKQPRLSERDIGALALEGRSVEIVRRRVVQDRIVDMVAAIASPGTNERLQFARHIVERQGIDPTTAAGKSQVRQYLEKATTRLLTENEGRILEITSLKRLNDRSAEFLDLLTFFHDRGLSSDTSIFIDFAIEQALEATRSRGMLGAGGVQHAAIIGPGLDFADKSDGYDFYPQQTLQPFAVIDSLIRLGLAKPDTLRLTTFDLNPRINQHLEAARQRARVGSAYVLQLPRDPEPWNSQLVTFWERFGDRIGEETKALAAPSGTGIAQLRAVRVRPEVVLSISSQDLNVVLQQTKPLAADKRFDLIIATNILSYYDIFEQSLALVNVAKMLRPGALFLANSELFLLPTMPFNLVGQTDVVYTDRPNNGDRLAWYQRQ